MTVGYPSDIKSGIERRFDEVEVSCPRDLSGREHNPGDEYDFAEMLFRFEHEGEEFDVGYSQGPFNDSGGEFELLATRDQNYAKL